MFALAACGGGGSGGASGGGGGEPTTPPPTTGNCDTSSTSFDSTFAGIQKQIFEAHGCTDDLCHGSSKQGGLQLTADVSYENLLQVHSTESEFNRIEPGDQNRSFLWLKLAAKTDPSLLPPGVNVAGAPMPNNLPGLSPSELELVRLWIFAGAPKTGTVGGTETLLDACLPPPAPITIEPLPAPDPGKGVQFVMPPWSLEAHSEHEICFATYYDITDQVPEEFKDPSGTLFRFAGQELRQDPQSHHLILNRYMGSADDVHDPSFGTWTCNGGETPGQVCEATDLSSCGSGTCTSEIKQSFACVGFGPSGRGRQTFLAIGGAQKAQFNINYLDGVFAQIPTKGILYWNSHAFNLTDTDTTMHARLNYYFAQKQTFPVVPIFDTSRIFSGNAAPYTTQTICNDHVLPQGARLFNVQSHTHKHGKHFSVTMPDGTSIYDSFVYNDPVSQSFNPPLAFDSADPKQRTLHYCSFYNNGVTEDGSPDPETVTRASRVPESAKIAGIGECSPTACAAGKVGASCSGSGDNASCDSSPGASDGLCDACRITGGESTENEMFILIGSYYMDKSNVMQSSGISAAFAATDVDAKGRSLSTDVIVPPQMNCGASAGAHAGHAAHASGG
ncbi:MAG TPA: hypothetical protein VFD92_06070 [Candidatus Binatia bacterium]|nr:hypothetical protein [Candidatus Binatia bacterium]